MLIKRLDQQYEIREMSKEEFTPLFESHSKIIFDDEGEIFRFRMHLNEVEAAKARELQSRMGNPYYLRLGVFHHDQFVGWLFGFQESAETFYMCNSAILPEHRLKGLYTQLMKTTLDIVVSMGFQKVYSRHCLTNNAILIPKLKAGFVMTTFEASDMFGMLVHLTYYPKDIRRKVLDYRVGRIKRDQEIDNLFK
ncbi:MAG: hypothetical protein Fur0010_05320 [Bdellovibrio sp.]